MYCPQMQAHLNPGTFVLVEMEAIEEQDSPFVEVCCIVAAANIPTYTVMHSVIVNVFERADQIPQHSKVTHPAV